jgi:hypothetical protein
MSPWGCCTKAVITSSPSFQGTNVSPVVGTPTPVLTSPALITTDLCSSSGVFTNDASNHQMQLIIYPNPFGAATLTSNTTATIRFSLPNALHVTLKVFDVLGREVATLVDGQLNHGEHSVVYNCSNLQSGVLFYRLSVGSFIETKKMLITK